MQLVTVTVPDDVADDSAFSLWVANTPIHEAIAAVSEFLPDNSVARLSSDISDPHLISKFSSMLRRGEACKLSDDFA